MESRIVQKGEFPTLEINGAAAAPLAYMTYRPEVSQYRDFQDIGTRIFSFGVYLGDRGINSLSGIRPFRPSVWKGEGLFDFRAMDEDLQKIVSGGESVSIIPRVYLDCPSWWEALHPDELYRDYSGKALRQSFASDFWRKETAKALLALVDHVEQSPWKEKVIGWQVAAGGTEEWAYHREYPEQYGDYSKWGEAGFRTFLEQKYKTPEACGRIYKRPLSSFAEIAIPTPLERKYAKGGALRDLPSEKLVVDFYEYHNHLIAETILYFCRAVKEHTGRRCITGAFYGYLLEIMNADFGHYGLDTVLKSPYIDFLASPNSYFDCRGAGIDWPFMSLTDSARLHGKLWFIEADTRTHLTRAMKENLSYADPGNGYYQREGVWKGPESRELSLSLLEKGFGKVLTGGVGSWWFDMWGGWYQDEAYKEFLKRAQNLMEQKTKDPAPSTAETAVFVDGKSMAYFALESPELAQAVFAQRKALGWMGAPYHLYQPDDLLRDDFDAKRYRVCIFLNCVQIGEETAAAVRRKLQRDGKTLVWVFMADRYEADGRPRESKTTGFEAVYNPFDEKDQAEYEGVCFPSMPLTCPKIETRESDRVLARFLKSGRPAVVLRLFHEGDPQKRYASVYSAAPNLSAPLLTRILALSGAHLYSLTGDVVYADRRHVCLHASSAGWKRIYAPAPCVFRDAWTGEALSERVSYFDFYLEAFETRTFHMDEST